MYIFNYDDIISKVQDLKEKINANYKHLQVSSLGGKENSALLVTISLDKKEDWYNGILQNSKYYMFHIDRLGNVENFNRSHEVKQVRKKKVNTLDEAIRYINDKIKVNTN